MKKSMFILILACLLFFKCKKEDDSPPPMPPQPPIIEVDEEYFKAFSMSNPFREILHDSINNLLYMFDRNDGEIISYDYENLSIKRRVDKNGFISDRTIALYTSQNYSEVYLGLGKTIYVYEGESLSVIDSIRLFENDNNFKISGIESPNEDILLIGPCNTSSLFNKGTIAFEKNTKTIISQAHFGGHCLGIKAYDKSDNTMGVISVGYATSRPELVSDFYTDSGELLSNNVEFFAQANISSSLIRTSSDSDYFITSSEGNIFSKNDLTVINTLSGNYKDFIINKTGSIIYALTKKGTVEMIIYPSLVKEKIKDLKNVDSEPIASFMNNNKMIVIYYSDFSINDSTEIFISKLDM